MECRTLLTEHRVKTGISFFYYFSFVLPVHNESMGDDDFVQVVLIVSGDTEEVQFVALLIISDLEKTSGSGRRGLNSQLQLRCASLRLNRAYIEHTQTAMLCPWQHCSTSQPPVYPRTHVTGAREKGGGGGGHQTLQQQ